MYEVHLNGEKCPMSDIIHYNSNGKKTVFDKRYDEEVKKHGSHDVYSAARVSIEPGRVVMRGNAFVLALIDMSNNYVSDVAAPWASNLANQLSDHDRLRNNFVGIKMVVSSNFAQALHRGAVMNGLWSETMAKPNNMKSPVAHLTKAFILFFTGFLSAKNEPLIALAVDSERKSDDISAERLSGLTSAQVAQTHQPYVLVNVFTLSEAKTLMEYAATHFYILRGFLGVPSTMSLPNADAKFVDLFDSHVEVRIRPDNPAHTVMRYERFAPLHAFLSTMNDRFPKWWTVEARKVWVERAVAVTMQLIRDEYARHGTSSRVTQQVWYRFNRENNSFKRLEQLLIHLVHPDFPTCSVPLVSVLEKWVNLNEPSYYSLVTNLTPMQAYTNARAFDEVSQFDC